MTLSTIPNISDVIHQNLFSSSCRVSLIPTALVQSQQLLDGATLRPQRTNQQQALIHVQTVKILPHGHADTLAYKTFTAAAEKG